MLKLIQIIFKNSDPASKKIQPISSTKINWLMLFGEVIVYFENHVEVHKCISTHYSQNAELLSVKVGGAVYSYC
jgi:hypothetical protein